MKNTQLGMTIAHMLIVLLLLAVASTAFVSFINQASRGQKSVQYAVDFDFFKTSLNALFNSKACDQAFRDSAGNVLSFAWSTPPGPAQMGDDILAGTPRPIEYIKNGALGIARLNDSIPPSTIPPQAAPSAVAGLKLTKMEILQAIYEGEKFISDPSDGIAKNFKIFTAVMNFEAKKPDAPNVPGATLKSQISLKLLTLPTSLTGTIDRCTSAVQVAAPALVCRVVKGGDTAMCESDEIRTGGGCAQNSNMYMYNSFPIEVSGLQGWRCQLGTTGSQKAFAICCNGANTATLPNEPLQNYVCNGCAIP